MSGSNGHDPATCDDPTHTDECPDCGAWVHVGDPWLAHRIEHEEDDDGG